MTKKILIVEDDKTLQIALKTKFQKDQELEILQAFNGKEGLEILAKEPINLILLDIVMPVMDGIEMLKRVRQEKKYDGVKIIILTNSSSFERSFQLANVEYLIKSNYGLDEILTKIKEALN